MEKALARIAECRRTGDWDEVSARDLCFYFAMKYEERVGVKYQIVWRRATGQMTTLLKKREGVKEVVDCIDYMFSDRFDREWGIRGLRPNSIGLLLSGWGQSIFESSHKSQQQIEVD